MRAIQMTEFGGPEVLKLAQLPRPEPEPGPDDVLIRVTRARLNFAERYATAPRELRAVIGETYPLERAAQAHIDLRERRTTGKLLLDPAA